MVLCTDCANFLVLCPIFFKVPLVLSFELYHVVVDSPLNVDWGGCIGLLPPRFASFTPELPPPPDLITSYAPSNYA